MKLSVGDKLGPYEITGLIGKGGMGEVYRATDTRLGRSVAIKVSTREFNDRFEREAKAISSLNHPNICTLYDIGPNYLVMEFVEGELLSKIIERGPLPLDKALGYAVQIVDALDAAHAKGVIHRDLKPGNIIVTKNGVKVLDFGLARLTAERMPSASADNMETVTEPITRAGAILGTLYYMSPEQVEAKETDERSDIFSFGVVVYEMITGQRPFQGDTQAAVLASLMKDQPAPMHQRQSAVPRALERVVRKCMEKKPEDRWRSAHDLKPTLELIDLEAPPLSSNSASVPIPVPTARKPWLWPAVAAVAVIGLGMAAWSVWPAAAPAAQEMRTQIPKPEDLTFNPGTQATISPDGKWLAFPALGPDNVSRMYLRSIDSLEVRPLQGSEGITGLSPPPFWSYDSRYVVYGAQGKLLKSEVTGTPAQSIAETGTPFVQGGTWSREGTIVYARNNGNLMQVPASGGTPAPLTALAPGERAHRWPQFLPDGKRFLYLRVGAQDKTGIYVGSLDVKPEAQDMHPLLLTDRQAWWVAPASGPNLLLVQREASLLAQPFDTASLNLSGTAVPIATGVGAYPAATAGMWSVARDGTLLYRSTGQNNPQMFWREPAGKVIGEPLEPNNYATPAVSPDGGRVAFRLTDAQGNADIWVRDLMRGNNTRLTFQPGPDVNPVWSPDGKKIAFAGQRDGRLDLYEKNADGSGEERLLLKSDQDRTPTSWSRDGKFILFASNDPKTQADLWVLPLDGSDAGSVKPFVFLKTNFLEAGAEFSSDGRWVAYMSDQSGAYQIYVRPFSGEAAPATAVSGAQWMISTTSGIYPRWSGDGKKLFFLNLNSEMLSVDVQSGPTFQAGAPRRMFGDVPPSPYGSTLAGDKFLFVAVAPTTGPVPPFTVVLNWTSRLRPGN